MNYSTTYSFPVCTVRNDQNLHYLDLYCKARTLEIKRNVNPSNQCAIIIIKSIPFAEGAET